MIIRVFRPTIHPGKEREFEAFIRDTAVPLVSQQSGLVAQHVGRPRDPSSTEFVYVTVWEDVDSIRAFAGERWQEAVITPDEKHLLDDTWIGHYESSRLPIEVRHRGQEPGQGSKLRHARASRTPRASSTETASSSTTRSSATASRTGCSCPRGRSSTPAPGRRRCPTWPATSGCSLRRAGQRPLGPALLVSLSMGAQWALWLTAYHPERVLGNVFIGPDVDLESWEPGAVPPFDEPYTSTEGWAKFNRHYWLDHWEDFVAFFSAQWLPEPHSTKQVEDRVGWGLETTPQVLVAAEEAGAPDEAGIRRWCARAVRPALVVHGDQDRINPVRSGAALARATGGSLIVLEGAGHIPNARDPVRVNLLIREFAELAGSRAAGRRP